MTSDGVRGTEQGLEGETGQGTGPSIHRRGTQRAPARSLVLTCVPSLHPRKSITIPLAEEKMRLFEVRQKSHLKVRLPQFIDSKLPSPLSGPTSHTALRKKTTQCGG